MAAPIVVVTQNSAGIQVREVFIRRLNYPYNLPDMPVPDGKSLLILAWPAPFNTGVIYVAPSREQALDLAIGVIPLLPGQFISYEVHNGNSIWISGTVIGDRISATSERG